MNRSETLDKAKACVCGQRENEYGSPEDNFAAIAGFWSVYKGVEFTANDVAMMMALLKIARIRTGTATPLMAIRLCPQLHLPLRPSACAYRYPMATWARCS